MKKILIIAVMFTVLVSIFGTASVVSADPGNPPGNGNGQGQLKDNGMKGRDGMMGRGGIVGRSGKHGGALHTLLVEAFAAAINITPEEFQAKLDSKMTILQVLREAGKTDEEILVIIHDAYAAALAKAVTEGLITQEQADWMQQKHDQVFANGSLPQNGVIDDLDGDEGEGEEISPETSPEAGATTGARGMRGFGAQKHFKHHKNR